MAWLKQFCDWFKWYYWTSTKCKHDEGRWIHFNIGMNKARHCKKCGRCLEIV